jgi:adenylate cyclase
LADGLADEITAGFSRFSSLRVVSRASAERVTGMGSDPSAAGAQLGARYVIQGGVRKAGTPLRVNVRLVDAENGAHLWAESYDRQSSEVTFALQDDVASRIVATVADSSGVLMRSMVQALRNKAIEELTPDELVLRFQAYIEQFRPEEHARLRDSFERAVEREPHYAEGWACLAMLYEHEHSHQLNPRPGSLERLRRAAERAVEIAPTHQHAWMALASAHFFARDLAALRAAVDRTIAINTLHTQAAAFCAIFLAGAGDTEPAVELVRRASDLNPEHQGWYYFGPFMHHYHRAEYSEALVSAKRINMPFFPWSHLSSAAAAGQLGRVAEAKASLDGLARTHPHFLEPENVRNDWGRWIWDEEMLGRLIQGFEKARALWRG